MNSFLEVNSGLKSRVYNYINFDDYTAEQIYQIFINRLKKYNRKFKISKSAKEELLTHIEKAVRGKDFGNGRFADSLFNKIRETHKMNVVASKKMDDFIITSNDISTDMLKELNLDKPEKRIGYSKN